MNDLPFTIPNILPTKHEKPEGSYAAVAMLISIDAGQPHLIVTKRSQHVRSHKGQVSFAGGKGEPADSSAIETALRETEEELGLKRAELHVIGQLPELSSIDGLHVIPFVVVGFDLHIDMLKIDLQEVAAVYRIPLAEVVKDRASEFDFTAFGKIRKTLYFETSAIRIWGLTAHIIHQSGLNLK